MLSREVVERKISELLEGYTFLPYTDELFERVQAEMNDFVRFMGAFEYRVVCDRTNNTEESIRNNELRVAVVSKYQACAWSANGSLMENSMMPVPGEADEIIQRMVCTCPSIAGRGDLVDDSCSGLCDKSKLAMMGLQGETEAIETVKRLGAQFGYGNLISHLQGAWSQTLQEKYEMKKLAADAGAGFICAWCGVDTRSGQKCFFKNEDGDDNNAKKLEEKR